MIERFLPLILLSYGTFAINLRLPPTSIDLLKAVNLQVPQAGVVQSKGLCKERNSQNGPDVAYGVTSTAALGVATYRLFPAGFPTNFSIISVFKPNNNTLGNLFTVYSSQANPILGLFISENPYLVYSDEDGWPGVGNYPKFTRNIASDE